MKAFNKFLALLLCAGLIFTSVPLKASAETKPEVIDTIQHVNPLYADQLGESPLALNASPEPVVLEADEYFTNMEDAGAHLREQLTQRMTTVSVGYKTTDTDYSTYVYAAMDEAMAHTGVPDEGDYILWSYGKWNCSISRSTSGNYNKYTFTYTMEYYTTAAQERQVDQRVDELLDEFDVYNDSDYEKIKTVYDYLCANITYDYDSDGMMKHTAYNGIMTGTCVCQGYALLMYRFALELGVDCRLIAGQSYGENHGWNIVKLGELYYNVDSTWDAGQSKYSYFLKGPSFWNDHTRFDDYTTSEFVAKYPVSSTDFVSCQGTGSSGPHNRERVTKNATCTVAGSVTEQCSVCGYVFSVTAIPATGHNYVNFVCTGCGDTNYPTYGQCGEDLNWTLSPKGDLFITGTGAMYDDYTKLGWTCLSSEVNSISLGEGITHIGARAFDGCAGVTSITLPSTLTSIGYGAFINCYGLTKITIPASVTSLAGTLFYGSGIKGITFEGSAPSFDATTFGGITAIAWYPRENSTWTSDVKQNYGGTVTWKAIGEALGIPIVSVSNVASTGEVKLTWNAVPDAAGYDVYYSSSKTGSFNHVASLGTTEFTDYALAAGKTRYYYVVAWAADGTASEKSNIVTGTAKLKKPTVTASNVLNTGKIKLTWKAVDGATSYKVYRSTTKNGAYKLMKTATGTSYTNTSAAAGTLYYYKVMAVNGNTAANSNYSAIVSRTCDLPRTTVTLSNVASSGKIKVAWIKVDGAAKYQVLRATTKNGTYKVQKTTTSLSWTDSNTTAGKTYYYKVRAVHSNTSANSALTSYKSRMADLKSPTVSITTSSGKPKVSWAAVTGATKYKIYRSTSKNGTYTAVKTTTSKSWKDTTAKKGKTYYYNVVAVHSNTNANSAYSAVKSIKCTK